MVFTISTSYTPGLRTWPASANRRVPAERPAPSAVNAPEPLTITHGRLDSVSTLLTTVGSP